MTRFFALSFCMGLAGGCQPIGESAAEAPTSVAPTTTGKLHEALVSPKCGNGGCHGQAVPEGKPDIIANLAMLTDADAWKSSLSHWALRDPHARSYETLKGKPSDEMMERLHPGQKMKASEEATCLACHSNPTLANLSKQSAPLIEDGVSCEACHGNARKYINAHLCWNNGDDRDKVYRDVGLNRLYNLDVRAATCMKCHVGSPEEPGIPRRDVNHDMIAAGHPRLNFEFTAYLRALPPHWTEKDRTTNKPILRDELSVWATGQTELAKATQSLTRDRAGRSPKPELAQFNCFACHHALGTGGGRPGSAGELVPNEPFALKEDPRKRLTTPPTGYLDWDEAQQRYLGLVAWHNSQKDNSNATHIEELLSELREQLLLVRTPNLNSPRGYNSEEARKKIGEIMELLK